MRTISQQYNLYLILDPGAVAGSLRFTVVRQDGKKVFSSTVIKKRKSIEMILARIDKSLKLKKYRLRDITGICVVRGGESFSAVRGVHAIANALGWSLQVPVRSVADSAKDTVHNAIVHCRHIKRFHLLLPQYSHEPNITVPCRSHTIK